MRILVLGASGGTGREVVTQALGHGHDVTAFVRDPSRFAQAHERLRIVVGDATDAAALGPAVEGQDAVVVALGSHAERPVHVYSDAVANVVRSMTARGVDRLVALSAAGAGARTDPALPFSLRAQLVLPAMREVYDDLERMEGDIMLSDLTWTIVRPAGLTDGPQVGHYRVVEGAAVPKGSRVSRADVAALLLKCAESELYARKAVAVAY